MQNLVQNNWSGKEIYSHIYILSGNCLKEIIIYLVFKTAYIIQSLLSERKIDC